MLYATAAAAAKSLQLCPTLCNPIDGSPPGSVVPGILQVRTLEWIAISFSNAWKWKVKVKSLSRVRLLVTPWTAAHQALCPWDFPGKSTGVGCHCLLWNAICYHLYGAFLITQSVKNPPALQETWVRSLGWEVPWRRKRQPTPVLLPGKSHGWRSLVSMGSQRVGHDWATSLSLTFKKNSFLEI